MKPSVLGNSSKFWGAPRRVPDNASKTPGAVMVPVFNLLACSTVHLLSAKPPSTAIFRFLPGKKHSGHEKHVPALRRRRRRASPKIDRHDQHLDAQYQPKCG